MNEVKKLALVFMLTTVLCLGNAENNAKAVQINIIVTTESSVRFMLTPEGRYRCTLENLDDLEMSVKKSIKTNGTFDGLQSNTDYNITCVQRNGSLESDLISFRTLQVIDIKVIRITDKFVRFTMRQKDEYNCTLEGENEIRLKIVPRKRALKDNYFRGLDPGTDYQMMCTSSTDQNRKSLLMITTLQAPSSQPLNVTATSVTNTTIVLQWDIPAMPNGVITSYVVTYNEKTENTTSQTTRFQLSGLTPFNDYTISVAARNGAGVGNSSETTVIRTAEGASSQPLNLESTNTTATTITLQWNPPARPYGNVKYYVIMYNDSTVMTPNNSTTFTLLELSPFTRYTVSVSAKNGVGFGNQSDNVVVRTTEGAPSTPVNLKVMSENSTCNSLTLSWETPVNNGGSSIIGYNITIINARKSYNLQKTMSNTITVSSLNPNTSYIIYVSAENSFGLGPPAVINATTEAIIRNVSISPSTTTSTSIEVKINDRNIQYNCWRVEITTENRKKRIIAETKGRNNRVLVFDGLKANTMYRIKCEESKQGCLAGSNIIKTRIGAPDSPKIENMRNISCTSISFSWIPPNNTGGDTIRSYTITYFTNPEEKSIKTVQGNMTSATVSNLSQNTMYIIQVRAHNSEQHGQQSNSSISTAMRGSGSLITTILSDTSIKVSHSNVEEVYYTCEMNGSDHHSDFNVTREGRIATRLQPDTTYRLQCIAYLNGDDYCLEVNSSLTTLPGKVINLKINGSAFVKSKRILQSISWERPSNHASQLKYIINYAMRNSLVNHTIEGTSFQLTFPREVNSHVVRVAAVSYVGQGAYEEIIINYTKPGVPTGIEVVDTTCTSVSFHWSHPSDTGGLPIMGYSIFHNYTQNKPLFNGQTTTGTAPSLLPGTSYNFAVRAKNALGLSGLESLQLINVKTNKRSTFPLQLRPFSSTKAHLIITPPDNVTGISYTCTYSSNTNAAKSMNTHQHNITLDRLKPDTTYNVTCLMYKEGGKELCYEGTATGKTFPRVPKRAPTNVTVTSTSSIHFTVEWTLPDEYKNNQDIQGYTVVYWEEGSEAHNVTNTTDLSGMYTATGLHADKVYNFKVAAFTAIGRGLFSEQEKIATIPTVQNIVISNISNFSALVQWNKTRSYRKYIIWIYLSVNDKYYSVENQAFKPVNLSRKAKFNFEHLHPFRSYTFSIHLQLGNHGNGSKEQRNFKTLGADPTKTPTNLSVSAGKRNVTLHWGIPPVSGRNGIITSYMIRWRSTDLQTSQQTSPINYTMHQPNFTHPEHLSRILEGLIPYTKYKWKVAAVNINGTGPYSNWKYFVTDEDVPDRVEKLTVNSSNASSIIVKWNAPSTPNGAIIAYSLCYWILGKKCMQPINISNPVETEESIHGLDPGIPYKVSVAAFTSAGQGEDNIHDPIIFTMELPPNRTVSGISVNWTSPTTVNISWTPLTVHQARGFPTYKVVITSEGRTVKSENTIDSHLSVKELDQSTLYSVSVQPLTDGGKTVGKTSNSVSFGSPTTQSSFPVWIVIIVVLLILVFLICLVILIIIVLFCKYKRQQKEADLMEEVLSMKEVVAVVDDSIVAHHNMQRKEPIPKGLFCEHVRKMHRNKDDRFKTEFGDITKEPPVSKEASESNRQRNRYINIYPYDYSRVVLSDSDGSDYVNAAFLDGYKSPKRYIASQGPTPVTTADFWEMIWEQKTTVIVMLTRLVEGTRIKCEQYWNEEMNATYEPGRNLRVTMTSNKVMTGFEVRQFRVEKTSTKSDPIKVKHFLYTAWPDHGVPQYTSSMVKFILHQYKPEVKDSATPIVVHCSAGAGRTGTFVAIDTAIDRLADEDDINIFECVELMRARRTQMVQNVSQYIYIHDAINDYVTCGETAIVAHELGQKKSEMNKTDPNTNKTGFEQLFKLLQETSAEVCDDDKEFSRRQDIAERNRYKTRYPYSDNFIQTEDDETYINATEIKGYYGQGTFIAAQAPMKNTIEDTWNVIRQQNCSVVVVLTNFEEQSQEMCAEFWPGEVGVPMEIGYMKISLTNTVHNEQFDEHKLSISVEEADIVNKVDVYHYKAWIKHSSPDVPSLLKLMGDVQRSHQGSSGPLMVMCDDGMSRSGVFITVMSEIDRVKVEGEMDIFHTVKAARTDRPNMVSTVGDYECCHEILQQYLESFDTYANFK